MSTTVRESFFDLSQRAVHAILADEMTQLRVPLLPQPPSEEEMAKRHNSYLITPAVSSAIRGYSLNSYDRLPKEPGVFDVAGGVGTVRELCGQTEWKCHLGVPGDRIRCREEWNREGGALSYLADGDWIAEYAAGDPESYNRRRARGVHPVWCGGSIMRPEDARIVLEIFDIRVERLLSVNAEGIRRNGTRAPEAVDEMFQFEVDWAIDHPIFAELWRNPWVYVIDVFRLDPEGPARLR